MKKILYIAGVIFFLLTIVGGLYLSIIPSAKEREGVRIAEEKAERKQKEEEKWRSQRMQQTSAVSTASNRVIRAGDEFTFTLRGPDDLRIYDIAPGARIESRRFYMDRGLTMKIRQVKPAGVWITHTYAPNDTTYVDFPDSNQVRFSSPELAPDETQKVIVTAEKYKPSRE